MGEINRNNLTSAGKSRRNFSKYIALTSLALASGVLKINSVIAAEPPRSSPDLPINISEYRKMIAQANFELANSDFGDRVFVVDLSQEKNMPELIKQISKQARKVIEKRKYISANKKDHIVHKLCDWIKEANNNDIRQTAGKKISYGINTNNPEYLSACFPAPINSISNKFSDSAFGVDNDGIPESRFIKPCESYVQDMDIMFRQLSTIYHEIGHGISGADIKHGETPLCALKRQENTADAFMALYIAKQGKQMNSKLEKYSDKRNVTLISGIFHSKDPMGHDTGNALEAVIRDLPRLQNDPSFIKASFSDLQKMAEKYACDALRLDYPHLYANSALPSSELEKITTETDEKLDEAARFAYKLHYNCSSQEILDLEKGRPQQITKSLLQKNTNQITPEQAAFLLRMSASMTRYTGKPDNNLSFAIEALKKNKPEIFSEALKQIKNQAATYASPERTPLSSRLIKRALTGKSALDC